VLTVDASKPLCTGISISGNTGSYFFTKTTDKAIKGPDWRTFVMAALRYGCPKPMYVIDRRQTGRLTSDSTIA